MEINPKNNQRISPNNLGYDFYQKQKKQTILISIGLIILSLSGLNSILWFIIKLKSIEQILIINATVLLLIIIILIIVINSLLKPFRKILNSVFPFTQAKKGLSQNFKQNTNLEEVLKQLYQLKSYSISPNNNSENSALTAFLQDIEAGILIFNNQKDIIYNNKFSNQLLKNKQLIFEYGFDALTIEQWIENSQSTTIHNTHVWDELSATDNTGQKRWFQVMANFEKDQPAETVLIILDVTETYSKKKNDFDFISFAAHELRGPITIIRGYLDILKDHPTIKANEETNSIIERLIVGGNRLSGYVNNILNVAKFDQKHLKLFIYKEKIEDIFNDIIDDLKLRAETQERHLVFEVEPNIPELACDKSSLSQVFTNLIDNAIKYSHKDGLIKVKAYKKGDYINVEIIDQGIGMPSNVVANLFKRFYRSHRSKESIGGTGIGLFISKAIVESHGGYITVESVYKEGSTFTVGIPIYTNQKTNQDNTNLLKDTKTGWIKNHGKIVK